MKKNKWIRGAAALLTALLVLPLPAFAAKQEAQTEEETVYTEFTVSSAADLEALAARCRLDSASRNLSVRLTTDISLEGYQELTIPTFGGIFDGGGHTIRGVIIHADGSHFGLFRYVQENAVIKNLNVTGRVLPGGSADYAGGVVGSNSGTLENVTFTGTVVGAGKVGGIAGENMVTGKLTDCKSSGYVRGDSCVGGIVGENSGILYGCVNKALVNTTLEPEKLSLDDFTLARLTEDNAVISGTDIGGVVGSSSGVIRLCRNEGTVGYRHTGYNVGGIAGSQSGFLADCRNYADVYARKEGGGIVGQMEPNNLLVYSEDTLQKLEKEIKTAQGILSRASSDASAANSGIQSSLTEVENDMNAFLDAVDHLLEIAGDGTTITPPDDDGELPDIDISNRDEIWAAAGEVGDRMRDVSESISRAAQGAADDGGVVLSDLQSLAGQMSKIVNVMSGREENPNLTEDVSAENVEEDSPGKIRTCINYGTVNADINSGGIVGSAAWENDLDPEDDYTVEGDSSLNFTMRTRALVYQCVNRGTVQAKRQCAGGIAGLTRLGALIGCENYGKLDAADATWVGGIAGKAETEISDCWAKSEIFGSSITGGIVGEGKTVAGCRSLTAIASTGEYIGAIAGKVGDLDDISGNYFVAAKGLGGIDGISYTEKAEPLEYRVFAELENLPDSFRKMVITFVADGGNITRHVDYGTDLTDIPEVPAKEENSGEWENFTGTDIRADRSVYPVYTPLQAAADSGEELPLALAEGSFNLGNTLTVTAVKTEAPEKAEAAWLLTIPDDGGTTHVLRLRKPESKKNYHVLLKLDDSWHEVDTETDGSYLVFSVSGNEIQVALVPYGDSTPVWITAGAAAAAAIILLLLILHRKKRKKAKKAKQK